MRIDRLLPAICLLLLLPVAQAGEAFDAQLLAGQQPDEQLDELEPVIIVGGYVTPKIWKVSKGDHVMWVLGNGGRAPAGTKWRTEQMEARIAESQLMLHPGMAHLDVDIGFLKIVTLLPAAFKATRNPDGKKLKDVLPPDIYARWRVIKTAYIGKDDDIEKWRPAIAIVFLQDKVMGKVLPAPPRPAGPPPMGPALRPLVDAAVKKYKVKVRTMSTVEREFKIRNAREILKSARETNLVDRKCFTQGLEYLERLVEYANQKAANPAAMGSAALPRRESCDDVLMKGLRSGEIPDPAGVLKMIDELERQEKLGRQQLDAEWVAAAQGLLAKNKSTFAVLPMYQARSTTGYLAKLKELGYTVEESD